MLRKLKDSFVALPKIEKFIVVLPIVGVVVAIAIFAWRYTHTEVETSTVMTQQEAETQAGVNTAAHNAGLTIGNTQSKEVATQIKYIYDTEQVPVYVVKTTGSEVETAVAQATKDTKADFSIVTSTDGKEYDLSKVAGDTKVELQQYNVQAYKPILRQVSYAPQEKIIGVSVAKKITKDGQYIGIGADYDIDDKKVYAKITYTW